QELFFDYSAYDPSLAGQLTNKTVVVTYGDPSTSPAIPVPSDFHSASAPGLFGQRYRGWAYAGYNGNRDRAAQAIDETALQQTFTKASTYEPAKAKAHVFAPSPEDGAWRGPDDLQWVTAGQMSSSRLGLDYFAVPGPQSFAGRRAV